MSGLFTFILVIQALVALVMITVILMQRSEGGGLTGGSPSGLMTARGAADFLTRTTSISATIFVILSILLAALAANTNRGSRIDESLAQPNPTGPSQPINLGPTPGAPAPGTAAPATAPAPTPAPSGNQSNGIPLAQ